MKQATMRHKHSPDRILLDMSALLQEAIVAKVGYYRALHGGALPVEVERLKKISDCLWASISICAMVEKGQVSITRH